MVTVIPSSMDAVYPWDCLLSPLGSSLQGWHRWSQGSCNGKKPSGCCVPGAKALAESPSLSVPVPFWELCLHRTPIPSWFKAFAFHLSPGNSVLAGEMEGLWVSLACLPGRKCLLPPSLGGGRENTLACLCQLPAWQSAGSCRSCALCSAGEEPCARALLPLLPSIPASPDT